MHRRRPRPIAVSFRSCREKESLQGLTIVSRGPSSLQPQQHSNKVTNVIKDMSNGFQIFWPAQSNFQWAHKSKRVKYYQQAICALICCTAASFFIGCIFIGEIITISCFAIRRSCRLSCWSRKQPLKIGAQLFSLSFST